MVFDIVAIKKRSIKKRIRGNGGRRGERVAGRTATGVSEQQRRGRGRHDLLFKWQIFLTYCHSVGGLFDLRLLHFAVFHRHSHNKFPVNFQLRFIFTISLLWYCSKRFVWKCAPAIQIASHETVESTDNFHGIRWQSLNLIFTVIVSRNWNWIHLIL